MTGKSRFDTKDLACFFLCHDNWGWERIQFEEKIVQTCGFFTTQFDDISWIDIMDLFPLVYF